MYPFDGVWSRQFSRPPIPLSGTIDCIASKIHTSNVNFKITIPINLKKRFTGSGVKRPLVVWQQWRGMMTYYSTSQSSPEEALVLLLSIYRFWDSPATTLSRFQTRARSTGVCSKMNQTGNREDVVVLWWRHRCQTSCSFLANMHL